jgi:GT2 family glycosyltransferase
VSVVVPHYGEPGPTVALVDALLAQHTRHQVQLIVSDDASPVAMPHIDGAQVVRRRQNGGFGSAVNTGLSVADHDLVLVLNSDIEVDENFIEDLLEAARPWLPAVVSPRVVGHDGVPVWTGRHFPRARHQFVEWLTPLARFRERRLLHEFVGHDTTGREDTTTPADWVVGAAMLMPTAEFRAVGGFDERFFMNCEEVDLQRRLRDRGLPSVVLAAPSVIHEGGGSSDPARRRFWLVRSRIAYADKWGFRRRLQVALALATGLNLCWNTGRRLVGRPVRPWATARQEFALITGRVDR